MVRGLLRSEHEMFMLYFVSKALFERFQMPPLSTNQIHVLVKLPTDYGNIVVDLDNAQYKPYSKMGATLQDPPQANAVVQAIKCLQNTHGTSIVLNGSTGMGTAFNLIAHDDADVLYMPLNCPAEDRDSLAGAFRNQSRSFEYCVKRDVLSQKKVSEQLCEDSLLHLTLNGNNAFRALKAPILEMQSHFVTLCW